MLKKIFSKKENFLVVFKITGIIVIIIIFLFFYYAREGKISYLAIS